MQIYLDKSCIGQVISETPYVKILSIPKLDEKDNKWKCLAQLNECLCIIEVRITPGVK